MAELTDTTDIRETGARGAGVSSAVRAQGSGWMSSTQ